MTVLKPRTRMISVRLSEEEYAALTQLCMLTGARSVSDLTRGAIRGLLGEEHAQDVSQIPIENFRAQISNLSQKIEQLAVNLSSHTRAARIDPPTLPHDGSEAFAS